ncbi:MAG: helix-turn-helix domain-containing protein [Acidobacteria bacterium]|nr:helix-turn-helix domain-containing protein [Acidobacteriota bacterium]MBI3471258.1 helix-turn-helix domain-containing protein [Candidatus Solibacter usitatus]
MGEKLRRRRLESGVSLDQIASQTKISVRMLQAIEAERYDRLPGGVFRKKFIEQYARAVGMDAEALAVDLKHLSQFDEEPDIPGRETPRFGSDMPPIQPGRDWSGVVKPLGALAALAAVILGCAGVYVWWQKAGGNSRPQPVIRATAAAVPAPLPAPPVVEKAPPAAAAGLAPASQPLEPASTFPLRVGIAAGERTWIQVSSDGKRVFASTLQPSQSKTIEAVARVRLVVGNAGGLEITLNGNPIGPIGPRGQVRVVEFTPRGFQIVSRKPPTAEPL